MDNWRYRVFTYEGGRAWRCSYDEICRRVDESKEECSFNADHQFPLLIIHEAAHAAVGIISGGAPREVRITRTQKIVQGAPFIAADGCVVHDQLPDDILANMRILLAGAAAERKASFALGLTQSDTAHLHAQTDFQEASRLSLYTPPPFRTLRRVWCETLDLLDKDSCWGVVGDITEKICAAIALEAGKGVNDGEFVIPLR